MMTEQMNLTEQHHIRRNDPRFAIIDHAAFLSKNLYNVTNYVIRQAFFAGDGYLGLNKTYALIKTTTDYKALPAKVSQQVLRQLDRNWQGYFAALKAYKANPSKFLGKPRMPHYKSKEDGRNILIYNYQAINLATLRKTGMLCPSKLNIEVPTTKRNIKEVRIVPHKFYYAVEIVYGVTIEQNPNVDPTLTAGIDIGLNNLAALSSDKQGFMPIIVNGRPLKSINQFYNKVRADLQSKLHLPQRTSHAIQSLTYKRNNKVKDYMHKASRFLINHLEATGIGTLVIGKNKNWKQSINIGKRNNQNFVSIPFARFVDMLTYKAKLAGIKVILQEESYTSKCSFLDLEPIQKQLKYVGRRIKRGLFRSANKTLINADVNAAYNIIRKAVPTAFLDGIAGVLVHPRKLTISTNKKQL